MAKKKRRKLSPAQKAALAKGRKKISKKRRSPVAKKRRSAPKRKTAKKTVRKVTKKKGVPPMAKKRKTRKSGGSGARRRSRRSRSAFTGRASGVLNTFKEGAIGIGGGLMAGFLANKLPVADPRIKAFAPIAGAVILAATLGKRNKIAAQLATGMMILGGVSAVRNLFPNVPMLAGEEEVLYLPNYSGENIPLADDDEDMGGVVDLAAEPEYISPADI